MVNEVLSSFPKYVGCEWIHPINRPFVPGTKYCKLVSFKKYIYFIFTVVHQYKFRPPYIFSIENVPISNNSYINFVQVLTFDSRTDPAVAKKQLIINVEIGRTWTMGSCTRTRRCFRWLPSIISLMVITYQENLFWIFN